MDASSGSSSSSATTSLNPWYFVTENSVIDYIRSIVEIGQQPTSTLNSTTWTPTSHTTTIPHSQTSNYQSLLPSLNSVHSECKMNFQTVAEHLGRSQSFILKQNQQLEQLLIDNVLLQLMVKNDNCAFHEEFNKLIQELNYYKKAYEDTNGLLSKAKNELMLQAEEINELEELNIFMEGGIEMLNSLLEMIDTREGDAQRSVEGIREELIKMVEYEEKAKNELMKMKNSKVEQVKLMCITNIKNERLRKEITRLRRKCSCLQGKIIVANVEREMTNKELKEAINDLKSLQVLPYGTQCIPSESTKNPTHECSSGAKLTTKKKTSDYANKSSESILRKISARKRRAHQRGFMTQRHHRNGNELDGLHLLPIKCTSQEDAEHVSGMVQGTSTSTNTSATSQHSNNSVFISHL